MRTTAHLCHVIFLASIVLSCGNGRSRHEIAKLDLKVVETVVIPIDSSLKSANSPIECIVVGNSEYLRFLNSKNDIITLDLDSSKYIKTHLSSDGPNGVTRAESLTTLSFTDSVLVKGAVPSRLFLVNDKGDKLSTYSMADSSEEARRGVYTLGATSWLGWKGNAIAFLYPDMNRIPVVKASAFVLINLHTGVSEILPFHFPKLYIDNNDGWDMIHYVPAYERVGDKLVVSFPASDSLFVFDLNRRKMERYFCPSNFVSSIEGASSTNMDEMFRSFRGAFSFFVLKYDPYRKVFYRFLLHPAEKETTDYALANVVLTKPFSLQVIDENFKLLGETDVFPGNKYQFFDSFVGKKGLYISNNNPKNPDANEEEISYTIFTLDSGRLHVNAGL